MSRADLILYSGLILAGVAVYLFISALFGKRKDDQILSWASGNEPEKSKSPLINLSRPLVHQFTIQHAARIKNQKYRRRIEYLLMTAGLSRELNVDEFIGLQLFWGLVFPVFMLIMNFALQLDLHPLMIIALGGVFYNFPEIYARGRKTERELSVRADLPFFIDLMALSVAAGLDFMGAIQRIVEKAQNSVLAEEFAIVLKDIKLNASRAQALSQLAKRIDINEINSFTAVVIDADATGSSISEVLKDQSIQMRLERFVRAEKAGARASQAILLPMMIFILPAVFLMVFGPVIVQMVYPK